MEDKKKRIVITSEQELKYLLIDHEPVCISYCLSYSNARKSLAYA